MPAIRFRYNGSSALAENFPCDAPVEVRTRTGEWERVKWQGFVCEAGAEMIDYIKYGAMKAGDVTNGQGIGSRDWRALAGNEYVVVIITRVQRGYAVFGVVDKNGWPIIKSDDKPKLKLVGGKTSKRTATIYEIDREIHEKFS